MGRLWWRRTPHLAAASSPAWRGVAAYSALTVALGAGLTHYIPGPAGGSPGPAASQAHAAKKSAGHVRTVGVFHHIVPPDLALTEPAGVSAAEVAKIAKIHGVRQVLALDGASISMGGEQVDVIGVNAQLYRSWTPLSTASNQQLWTALSSGAMVASPQARQRLHLQKGLSYSLTGRATVNLPYAGAAPLGIAGIDLVVGAKASAELGLVHHVVALISAPSLGIRKLRREVRAAAGHGTKKIVTLREQTPAAKTTPTSPTSANRPTTYFQLFQESAALYCPGLPWTVLAAIGQIESGDGANEGPSSAGALGPMQFIPSTWAEWGMSTPWAPGPPDVTNPFDAVPAAARYLCAAGGSTAAGLPGAIFAYNHAQWYVNEVLALAREYAQGSG
jgi:transglycosylase-like protein with SLT domain